MKQKVIDIMMDHGILVHPQAAEHILSQKDPVGYTELLIRKMKEPPVILTMEVVQELENSSGSASITLEQKNSDLMVNATEEIRIIPQTYKSMSSPPMPGSVSVPTLMTAPAISLDQNALMATEPSIDYEAQTVKSMASEQSHLSGVKTKKLLAKEYEADVRIIKDITGNSTTDGSVKGFTDCFRDRFACLGALIRNKREMAGAIEIKAAKHSSGRIKVVGMVNEVRLTKNGNKMLMLEDEDSILRVIITKDNKFFSETTVVDEVIGVIGTVGRNDMVLLESIVRPDIPGMRIPTRAKVDLSVAFISDVHMGSRTFLPEQWERFTGWLREGEDGSDRIKYIVIAGDIVDGVGVFPGQEAELAIPDIHDQYQEFARKLSDIPEYIRVIMLPGNHDAVRPSEPQPTFSEDMRKIMRTADTQFVGNPSVFAIEGVQVLAYHGRSMDDFISHFPGTTYNCPLPVMKEMLRRRHLAPIYGDKTPIAPESKDYLVIDSIPDIFVTGHVHAVGLEAYRGVYLINASTWQSQTSYQVMHNFNPVPAKVPVINLQNGDWEIMNFL